MSGRLCLRRLLLVALLFSNGFLFVMCSVFVVVYWREVFVRSKPLMLVLIAYPIALICHVLVACLCAGGFKIVPPLLSFCLDRPVAVARDCEFYKVVMHSPVLVKGIVLIL